MILLENLSTSGSFIGWHRVTVRDKPLWSAATVDGRTLVVGLPVGNVGWGIDVHGRIDAGQRISIDLSRAVPRNYTLHADSDAISDPVGFFGIPSILGVPLALRPLAPGGMPLTPDGACFLVRLSARIGPLFADLWLRAYPGQQRYSGTLRLTCSDISQPTLFYELPEAILGLHRGFRFADGQSIMLPVQWQRDTRRLVETKSPTIVGRGIDSPGWLGIPAKGSFDLERFYADKHPHTVDALTSWRLTTIGIVPNAGVAGDQEDQGFAQGFESYYGGSLKCLATRAMAALQWAKRPCHHLEPSGEIVDPEARQAVYWSGRPIWWSPNQFNKPRSLGPTDCSGWYGPDLEHHLIHTLATDYELRQDPGVGHELTHLAHVYLGSETLDPRLATTTQFVARALGWNSLVAAHLYRLLPDRALAERVKARWLARVALHRTRWGSGFWDVRQTPPESMWVSPGVSPYYCMLYQMAVGVFGVYAAAEVFDAPSEKQWAASASTLVLSWAWDNSLLEWEIIGLSSPTTPHDPASYQEGRTAHRSGFYRGAWLPLAAWVAHDAHPHSEFAQRVMAKLREDEAVVDPFGWFRCSDWLPPARR